MPLPKTKHPLFEATIPSTDKIVVFRQMLVSDEKILLMAKASADDDDIYRAVKQVVNNCIYETNIDSLTTFDIEFLFIKIRSASIGSTIELTFNDRQDEQEYKFVVDLDSVEVVWPDESNPLVKISDDQALKLRYPPASLFEDERALGEDSYEYIASKCIEKIYDGEDVYTPDDATDEELLQWIMELDTKSYAKVKDFIANMPRLNYTIEYKNKEGTDRKIVLTTLTDFFTLR